MVPLHDASLDQAQISEQLKVSRCYAQHSIKEYKQLDPLDDVKHAGRPEKLSGRDIRHLKGLVKGDSSLGASKIVTDLNASLPEPIITSAIRRYLKGLGLEYVVKVKKTVVKFPSSTTVYYLV